MLKWLYYGGTQSGSATIDIGTLGNVGYRMPRYNNQNTSSRSTNPSSGNNSIYSYGNYYTWAAAMANTEELNNSSIDVYTSLCPANWYLPSGGGKTSIEDYRNSFWNLIVQSLNSGVYPANYNNTTNPYYSGSSEFDSISKLIRSYPNNFVYSGVINNSLLSGRGSNSYYWTASASDVNYAYGTMMNSSSLYPGTYNAWKYFGETVRCRRVGSSPN